jgi:hypothetical protein
MFARITTNGQGRSQGFPWPFYFVWLRTASPNIETDTMILCLSKMFLLAGLLLCDAIPAATTTLEAGPSAAVSTVCVGDNSSSTVLLAEGWSIGKWFSGSGGRTRVVQFCVVTMCIALFIMMRKLS